jgi:hypothetical protein
MKALRLVARLLATLVVAMWLFVIVASLLEDGVSWDLLPTLMGTLVLGSSVATGIAWWRARLGAILLLLAGVLFAVFALCTAGQRHAFAVATSGGPFLLAGALLLVGSRETPAA